MILEFAGTDDIGFAVAPTNPLVIRGLVVETALFGTGVNVILPAAAVRHGACDDSIAKGLSFYILLPPKVLSHQRGIVSVGHHVDIRIISKNLQVRIFSVPIGVFPGGYFFHRRRRIGGKGGSSHIYQLNYLIIRDPVLNVAGF